MLNYYILCNLHTHDLLLFYFIYSMFFISFFPSSVLTNIIHCHMNHEQSETKYCL